MTRDENPERDETLSSDPIVQSSGTGKPSRQRWNFGPDEVIGERYRVIRFIAEGGLGAVWEAEDLELGERVALKALRAGHEANETSAARFRREVQLARRVTHPNVCRTYDSFTHSVQDENGSELARFLVVSMELLEGETLSDRIARDGPLSTDQALPIVRQVVAGLLAAHRAGVIHRDLKSRNIILVPGKTGPRAVITDFGLAKPTDGEGDPSLTESGALVGTPAYMAPEQILGKDVTTASDIYSLGVVLYEMVTGERPFAGGTAISIAVQRLKGPPRSPASLKPGLQREWETVILRCLELEPPARYAEVGDIVEVLEGRGVAKPTSRARNRTVRQQVVQRVAAVLILLATITVIAMGVTRLNRAPEKSAEATVTVSPDVTMRRSIAVMPFRSLSGREESRWVSIALAELLRSELAAAESLRVAPTSDVARAVIELELLDDLALSREKLEELRPLLGTDLILEGSFLNAPPGDALRADVRLVDQKTGEVLFALSQSGSLHELSGLTTSLGEDLRSYLDAAPLDAARKVAIAVSYPDSREVMELYVVGLWSLASSDAQKASGVLDEAVRLEPLFAPAHAALADAWWTLGMRREAKASAEAAVELSEGLSRAERLNNEARLATVTGELTRAIEIYEALFRFFPDERTYGLALAKTQVDAGLMAEAAATIEAMRQLPGVDGRDPRIEIAAAELARQQADFTTMAKRAQAAAARAHEIGARLLEARAQLAGAEALRELGRYDEARSLSLDARSTFRTSGDSRHAAEATALVASIEYYRGRYEEAERLYAQALDALLDAGDIGQAARVANAAGGIPFIEGRLGEAEDSMRQANALAKQAGDKQLDVVSLINLSQLRELAGYGDEAIALAGRFESDDASERSPFLDAASYYALGRAQLCKGQVGRSKDALGTALELLQGSSSSRYEAMVLVELGRAELQAGDLEAAQRAAERALEIRERLADRAMICESRALLGEIALARGDASAAEAHARAGLSAIVGGIAPPLECISRDVLARALLERGEVAEAEQVLAEIESGHQENPHIRIAVDRTRALVLAANASRSDALEMLGEVETESRRYGIVPERLSAQLAAIRIRMKEDPSNPATLRLLSQLEAEATRLGFGLIARDAARLMGVVMSEV